ncbi:Retrovirus-related Pol polyprotein from transposon RE2 [Vitis vinifera]|uniref:Retrovirus-related Pol polyprotein from transposon RE2 n=1 Tax=Vitis vinifera TaxID=29760 RepID=A0A438IHR0_VITVI|nr:Retrovirus-related Pol polyprotein from transposon RE2 [Vitis vinifera]
MLDSKPTTTPGLLGQTLSHLDSKPLSDATLYRSTALYPMAFRCNNPPHWIFMDIVMQTRHLVQMIEEPLVAMASSLIIWIQYVLQELCLSSSSPPLLWCDNKSAAHLAANPVFHAKAKHIEMEVHFIRDHVLRKQLIIQYLPSSEQVADIFTKHISSSQFLSFITKLSVVPSPMSLQGDDRRYLADQQESNCPGSAATNRD